MIPENALPSTDPPLQLEIQPCFMSKGSFDVPQGIELVSPAYIVHLSRDTPFEKAVSVKIWHHANLESEEDCEDMVFLSASTRPEDRRNTQVYIFREIEEAKGSFKPKEDLPAGQIDLKRLLCRLYIIGKKCKRDDGKSECKDTELKCKDSEQECKDTEPNRNRGKIMTFL